MRGFWQYGSIALFCTMIGHVMIGHVAHAQGSYLSPDDPCSARPRGNIINELANGLTGQQRQQACDEERREQWADYYARQEQQRRQATEQEAEEHRQELAARAAQRAAFASLMSYEQSPDNHCRQPEVAKVLLDSWSSLDAFKNSNISAVDIEHLTTLSYDASTATMQCHGVYPTNTGSKLAGTLSFRKNIAGEDIVVWTEDQPQDLSIYETPPPATQEELADSSRETGAKPTQLDGTQPPLQVAPVSVDASAPTSAGSEKTAAFNQGLTDRRKWEGWFGGLAANLKSGAQWWAANRSLPGHGACAKQADSENADWLSGCLSAEQMLGPIDDRRHSEADYRAGWNSL